MHAFWHATRLDPNCAPAWLNLGNVLSDGDDCRKAIACYARALKAKPDYAKAFVNMGNALAKMHLNSSALTFYDRAIGIDPKMAAAYPNKASCLTALKRYREADNYIFKALDLGEFDERLFNTLGNLRAAQEMNYAAAAAYRVALLMNHKYAPLHTNLGNIYSNIGNMPDAIAEYERGLILEPTGAGVRYNLALAYLRTGDYRLGWPAYESRWGFHELCTKPRGFTQPEWHGEPFQDKRILVHAEQGMGDTIQFCRYLPLVARRGGVVFFEVQHRLQRLMATVEGVPLGKLPRSEKKTKRVVDKRYC